MDSILNACFSWMSGFSAASLINIRKNKYYQLSEKHKLKPHEILLYFNQFPFVF